MDGFLIKKLDSVVGESRKYRGGDNVTFYENINSSIIQWLVREGMHVASAKSNPPKIITYSQDCVQ